MRIFEYHFPENQKRRIINDGIWLDRVLLWKWFFNIWLFAIIFIAAFFVTAIMLKNIFASGRKSNRSENENKPTASEILNERYVKGDISKKEYELIKKDLGI